MHSMPWSLARCQAKHCQYAEEIATFLHEYPQKVLGIENLYHILSLYEKWWIFVGKYRSEPFEKCVLYYIAERTFWSDVKDGEFAAKLLRYLYQVDNHFSFFLCPNQDHFPSMSNFDGSNNNPTRFFLNHAYQQRLTISGKRIADLKVFSRSLWLHPCEMAVISESPELLLLLLQYGALITEVSYSVTNLRHGHPAGNMAIITVCIIKTIIKISRQDSSDGYLDMENPRINKMILCARYIVRACPQLEKQLLNILFSIDFPGFCPVQDAIEWVTRQALPDLSYRIHHPLPLQHACRLIIRKALHANWQLPLGIDKLPLPTMVKKYLNLQYD